MCVPAGRLRRGGLLIALVAVLAGWPAVAHAGLSWSDPVFLNEGGQIGMGPVSCPSSTQCTAMDGDGKDVTFNPSSPRGWSAYKVDPHGVAGVSCPAVNECVAVDGHGEEVTFDPDRAGTEHLRRIDAYGLGLISCPSTSQCTAGDSSGRVVTFQPGSSGPSNVRSLTSAELAGISCPTASQCTVIDTGNSSSGIPVGTPRLITFDPAASAAAVKSVTVAGLGPEVACPKASECVATVFTSTCGSSSCQGGTVTFDPNSNTTPTVEPRSQLFYLSIACSSAQQCTAMDMGGNEVTFDPESPSFINRVFVDPRGDYPKGENRGEIDCPVASLCAVVSSTSPGSAEMTFDPQAPRTPPAVPVDDGAPAVTTSCPAANECVVLGRVISAYLPSPVAASVTVNPRLGSNRAGGVRFIGNPVAMSCPNATQCTVVSGRGHGCAGCQSGTEGDESTFDPQRALEAAPVPPRRIVRAGLTAISCPAATHCVATDVRGTAISFDPRKSRRRTKLRLGSVALTAIACRSPDLCVVVDRSGQAISFNALSRQRLARGRIDAHQKLVALSCPSSDQCTAVDRRGYQVTFRPSTERVLARHRVARSAINGVSCRSTAQCVAISSGSVLVGNPRSGRAWSRTSLLGASALEAVACRAHGRCLVADAAGHAYRSRR